MGVEFDPIFATDREWAGELSYTGSLWSARNSCDSKIRVNPITRANALSLLRTVSCRHRRNRGVGGICGYSAVALLTSFEIDLVYVVAHCSRSQRHRANASRPDSSFEIASNHGCHWPIFSIYALPSPHHFETMFKVMRPNTCIDGYSNDTHENKELQQYQPLSLSSVVCFY